MLQHRPSLLSVLAAALILFSVRPAQAFWVGAPNSEFSNAALSGISAVTVSLVGFHPDFSAYGLDSAALKASVEKRLRSAGLKVVSAAQAESMPDAAQIEIDLHTVQSMYAYYSYSTSIKVKQKIPLPGRKGAFVPVVTWTDGQNGIVLPSEIRRIGGLVLDHIDRFISDYHAQNPTAQKAR